MPQYAGENKHILALEVISEERQRDEAAAVHRVDLLGVPEVAALAGVHAQGGVPIQRVQVVLLRLGEGGKCGTVRGQGSAKVWEKPKGCSSATVGWGITLRMLAMYPSEASVRPHCSMARTCTASCPI